MGKMIKYVLVLVAIALMLVGCGKETAKVQVVNPIQTLSKEEIAEKTGILLAIPEESEDVVCSLISGGNVSLAQAKFTINGMQVTLRAQATDQEEILDISGLYYEWTETTNVLLDTVEAQVNVKGDIGYIAWVNAGVAYNLSMTQVANTEILIELAKEVLGIN